MHVHGGGRPLDPRYPNNFEYYSSDDWLEDRTGHVFCFCLLAQENHVRLHHVVQLEVNENSTVILSTSKGATPLAHTY